MTGSVPEPNQADRSDAARRTCFVIGPIGNRFAATGSDERATYEEAIEVWEEVISRACKIVGLQPVRADGLARAGEITEQVFRRLRDDDVVIADLTGGNPNVMYELGLRHTRNLLTVQIGEFGRLPFDVNMIRTVMFSRSPRGLINARDELVTILEQGLLDEYDAVTATCVWVEEADLEEAEPAIEPEQAQRDSSEEEAAGFLDLVAEAEDRSADFLAAVQDVSEVIARLGNLAVETSEEMNASDRRGAGMRGRLAVAVGYASKLNAIAEELEDDINRYAEALHSVSAGNLALIDMVEQRPSELLDTRTMNWAKATRRLAKITRGSMSSLDSVISPLEVNAQLTRVLRGPTRRIATAFRRMQAETAVLDEWDRRLQALGVVVPPDEWEPDWSDPNDAASIDDPGEGSRGIGGDEGANQQDEGDADSDERLEP